ncbi:hypothetical protein OE09_1860 [Flavobacteriaceae bacterium MAR_2010_72]|nr:hypothetical protein OE09_1860 [Flavobacteriaceae bacterium MAR_2010_72]TVZ59425.1 hypothetical protein NA63_1959 [Flavobacteriaceae bacterium MAR_2010_105]
MILKAFKEKSNQKYINKLLSERTAMVHNRPVNSVGVILHLNEFSDFEAIRTYFKSLGLKANRIKIVGFAEEEKDLGYQWETYVSSKDFGWKGKINNVELQTFIDTEFDALISFYQQSSLELNLITAQSKANFKVGLSNKDQRLYDLIINVSPDEFDLFKNELKKYLTVLNKL